MGNRHSSLIVRVAALAIAVAAAGPSSEAHAQSNGLDTFCDRAIVTETGAREACVATAQAIASAQPLLGIAIAGGNPTLGTAGSPGLRLGVLPRVSAGIRLTLVPIELPDILQDELAAGEEWSELGVTAPALGGEAAIGLFDGLQLAPGMGGIGGLSVLGSATVLPFEFFDTDGFDESDFAWGIGGRVNLIEESFYVPGVALSVMRRSLPDVSFGDICPSGISQIVPDASFEDDFGVCSGGGDAGEFSFDLTNWSTRLVASKRLFGLGATLGLGRDSYDSSAGLGFRAPSPAGSGPATVFRVHDVDVESSRWTVFGNLSFTLLVASIAAEAGWVQGDSPIGGFSDLESNFDPGDGSWYGAVGARLSL